MPVAEYCLLRDYGQGGIGKGVVAINILDHDADANIIGKSFILAVENIGAARGFQRV